MQEDWTICKDLQKWTCCCTWKRRFRGNKTGISTNSHIVLFLNLGQVFVGFFSFNIVHFIMQTYREKVPVGGELPMTREMLWIQVPLEKGLLQLGEAGALWLVEAEALWLGEGGELWLQTKEGVEGLVRV